MAYFARIRLLSTVTSRSIKPDVISLQAYAHGNSEDRTALATKILDAGSKTGFFYVTNWPDSSQGINFLDEASNYFNRASELKAQDITPVKDGFTRGYLSIGSESGSPDLFERKEAFSYGYDGFNPPVASAFLPRNSLEGHNTWPRQGDNKFNAEHFRTEAVKFYNDNINTATIVSCLIGLSLGVSEDEMLQKIVNASSERISLMRLFHYLTPHEKYDAVNNDGKSAIGSSPHTDWGYLTLIMAEEAGLEANIDDEWVTIEPLPKEENAFLINCGDWLAYHTRGRYVSPLHRVRAAVDRERFSSVFFHYPDYNADGSVISSRIGDIAGNQDFDFKNLGLLKDQVMHQVDSESSEMTIAEREAKMLALPFGSFISNKWESVQRKGTVY